jgi:cell division initiation protein
MALTPVEIRHIRLHKALFGYQVKQADELLQEVVTSFEDVWRDRADLADKIEQLESELVRYHELEQLLRTTLISAERASQQMTEQARREMEVVLSEARAEAREIVRGALAEREQLNADVNRIRAQMSAALKAISEEPQRQAQAAPPTQPAPAPLIQSPRPVTAPPPSPQVGASAPQQPPPELQDSPLQIGEPVFERVVRAEH